MSQQINLFNPIFLKQKKYFSAVTMAQALGLILLGTVALAGYAGFRSVELKKEAAVSAAQAAQAKSQLEKARASLAPRQKSQTLETEIGKVQAELDARNQALATLQKDELGNRQGYAEYLRAFSRQIVSGLWLTGFTIQGAGKDIAIEGRALQPELVPQYLGRLRGEPSMQGKSFATFDMRRPQVEAVRTGASAAGSAAASAATSAPAMPAHVEFRLSSIAADAQGGQSK